ncbi:four-helix bundle copper-binding protein [Chelativorans sp. J32]|uniref:four-helix bundle copper-binding protein n=1 Tax=Chelativorans sp. J32 TaxID=935840 RepID=UPI0004B0BCB7|nr:four-helix bundle copper-binding protein [Chelativorans sp. J32]
MHVQEMISAHPDVQGGMADRLLRCIEECYNCAQTCTACADACLAESSVDMLKQCIRLDLDCADVCTATGALASRRTGRNADVLRAMIQVCEQACRTCADECRKHADHHEHCRICAEVCLSCAQACREAIADVH